MGPITEPSFSRNEGICQLSVWFPSDDIQNWKM